MVKVVFVVKNDLRIPCFTQVVREGNGERRPVQRIQHIFVLVPLPRLALIRHANDNQLRFVQGIGCFADDLVDNGIHLGEKSEIQRIKGADTCRTEGCYTVDCFVGVIETVIHALHFEQHSNPGENLPRIDRFGDEIFSSHLDPLDPVLLCRKRRNHNHGDVPKSFIFLDPSANLKPVDLWHHYVEQHEVDSVLPDCLQGSFAVLSLDYLIII